MKNPQLKTDKDRADEFHDRIGEIGADIELNDSALAEAQFMDIDIDNYVYLYRFDVQFFDGKSGENGMRLPVSIELTDAEYIDLLAHFIHTPECSFNQLAYLSPKLRAIYKKVSEEIHNSDFGFGDYLCYEHDYAILMTEVRHDVDKLIKQLEKKGEQYPYLNFLNDLHVNIICAQSQQKK